MTRFIILSCLILLALTKASLSPVFAISSNPSIPSLVTLNDLVTTIEQQHVPYLFFDITSAADTPFPRNKLRSILQFNTAYTLKHSSVINEHQLSILKQALPPSTQSNTYTLDNLTLAKNKTGRVQIEQNLLNANIFEQISPDTLVILHFHEKTHRLLQNNQTQISPMLSVMTPSALSGLLVSLFLLVVLLIAVGCLTDLKTNDRFPRSILQVGKES